MSECKHYKGKMCKHPEQSPSVRFPSDAVCARCPLYEGPPRGLGDTVAQITEVTGIKAVVDAVAGAIGKDCGCAGRRASLNQAVPYEKK